MKKSTFLYTALIFFITLLFPSSLFAGNVLGGEISHTAVGPNQYEITLKRYRDCTDQGSPTTTRTVNWTGSCGSGSIILTQSNSEEINPFCLSQGSICNGGGGTYGVILYTYTGILTVPAICTSITVSYQVTYRPGALANIFSNGSNRSEYIFTGIDNSVIPFDSSPSFVESPTFFITQNTGTPQVIKNEVSDIDGDSIVFHFTPPSLTSTNLVGYRAGFNYLQPLGAGVASINLETGDITITDPSLGLFTIAVLVEQYRNGVLIGTTVRDWSLRVLAGSNAVPSISGINGDVPSNDTLYGCTYSQFCFDVIISDSSPGDILGVSHTNLDPDISINTSPAGVPSGNQITTTICGTKTTPGTHFIELTAFDDACPLTGKSTKTFTVIIKDRGIGTDTRTECDSLIWIDGNTYYTDNNTATFNIIGGAANTCDSLVTLDLTIINSVTGIDTRTECDSLVWIDGNTYYTDNNTAEFNIIGGAANTCDSLVTLDLTIINSVVGTDSRTECDSLIWIDGNTYYTSNSTAEFNIIGGAANTCDSLVTLDLTIITIDTSVTQSGALLTANESGLSYQWINCPELTPIVGATNQSFTADSNGDYAVVVTNNLCSDTSDCFTVTGVGIIENEFGNNLLLFPNPTNGNFSVDLGAMYDEATITITDLMGRTIQSTTFYNSQSLNLNIEEPAGTYLLVIEAANKKAVIRLIKE